MRILLISQHFYPESFKCNDVAFDLAKRGNKVTVLTGIPNYPKGSFFDGYGLFKKRREKVKGVRIIRLPLIPRGKSRAIELVLNYFSWSIIATIWMCFHALVHKYDCVLVHETSPVMQAFPAVVVKKIQKIPFYFWVLDLWPESLCCAGDVNNKHILGFFEGMVRYLYKQADKILISSKGFKRSICEKGNFASKIVYFPNWAEDVFKNDTPYQIPELPDGFKIMFAGNIGEAQDFDHIMEAALLLKDNKDIKFVLVGDGRKRAWIEDFVKKEQLQETVHLMGRHPLQAMPAFFNKADVMLVSLKNSTIFNLTAPAKLQAYMASAKPIAAMLNGEGAGLVKEAKCGMAVPAEDAEGLAKIILELYSLDAGALRTMGENGKYFCDLHFNKDKCIDHLCDMFDEDILVSDIVDEKIAS